MGPSRMAKLYAPLAVQLGLVIAVATSQFGCNPGPQMAPVRGVVSLDGKPLGFGVVMLQPVKGQAAQAQIGADGKFDIATFTPGDGAPLGRYAISVLCYEGHNPSRPTGQAEGSEGFLLGKSLIPLRYTRASSSGLTVDVPAEGVDNLILDLHSRGKVGVQR